MKPRMNQIALSVVDREASKTFYAALFKLAHVGGTHFTGKVTEQVQGMPGATSDVAWLMDDREFFQLELFQFSTPVPRAYAANRQPWDIGYSRLAVEVADLPGFHASCVARGVQGLGPIRQVAGKDYFVMTDPNGVLIEVGRASRPIGAGVGARLVGVALSVPNLGVAVQSFQHAIGCPLLDSAPADKGVLWDEPPGEKRSVLLDAGTCWLEISEYQNPAPAPWPAGYRISDHGLLNVAFGSRDAGELRGLYQRMVAAGFRPNTELVSSAGQVLVTYLNDPQGFNVELLMVKPWLDGVMGFRPANWFDRILMKIMMAFV
ncbi:VOC family protein [Pseudomonas sp. N040]|uniref:VOC family protein n=1 Tax=Pseudomonas sp. N040 TaxID=2785325 RepID=UPI0018A24A0D|nr:VOC family protein [Pseudomonas sp. N040]MBF7729093.1 VOC family protein [Pseudomonas sp. N040]MBW7012733.1 VOC family protein [Pseudomonas sp. N040]